MRFSWERLSLVLYGRRRNRKPSSEEAHFKGHGSWCNIASIMVEFIIQLYILKDCCCLRPLATDRFFKDNGVTLPEFWDPSVRSQDILRNIKIELASGNRVESKKFPAISRLQLFRDLGSFSSVFVPPYDPDPVPVSASTPSP